MAGLDMTSPGRGMVLLVAALAAASCASGPSSAQRADEERARPFARAPQPSADAPTDIAVGTLSGRRLAREECGLFLWRQSGTPEFVFFSSANTAQAAMVLDGEEVALARTNGRGDTVLGQFVEQTFASGPIQVQISVTPGEVIERGQRIPSGRLRLTHTSGWSAVLPVAGMAGCQP